MTKPALQRCRDVVLQYLHTNRYDRVVFLAQAPVKAFHLCSTLERGRLTKFTVCGHEAFVSFDLAKVLETGHQSLYETVREDVLFYLREHRTLTLPPIQPFSEFHDFESRVFGSKVIFTGTFATTMTPHLFALAPSSSPFVFVGSFTDPYTKETLRHLLDNPNNTFVGYRFDLIASALHHQFSLSARVFDVYIAAHALWSRVDMSLPALGAYLLDVLPDPEPADPYALQEDEGARLSAHQAWLLRHLHPHFCAEITRQKKGKLIAFLTRARRLLTDMEQRGVFVDCAYVKKLEHELKEKKVKLQQELPFSPINDNTIRHYLFSELHIPPLRKTKKQSRESIDKMSLLLSTKLLRLSDVQKKAIQTVLAYKEIDKMLNTFIEPLWDWLGSDGRIHTHYHLFSTLNGGARSGRLSSSHPNLQNIPASTVIRRIFRAPEGRILGFGDYSQIELRVAAVLSRDERMLETFQRGEDIHTKTLAFLLQRSYEELNAILHDPTHREHEHIKQKRIIAKTINFSTLYGISPRSLALRLALHDIFLSTQKAAYYIQQWFAAYPQLHAFITEQKTKSSVTSPFGRTFSFLTTHKQVRQIVNYPIQSTASDMCLLGALLLSQRSDLSLVMTIHDSLVWECEEDNPVPSQIIQKIMEEDVKTVMREEFQFDFPCPLVFHLSYHPTWRM
ncbi:MAG: DNA polymerase A family protein [Candidatus Nitrosotenuis sp.]